MTRTRAAGKSGIAGLMVPGAIIACHGAPRIRRKQAGVFPDGCRQPVLAAMLVSGTAKDLYFMNISRGFTPC